jgi:hypothetical protein
VRNIPIFPLAKLGPLGLLTAVAAVSAAAIVAAEELPRTWAAIGLLPLCAYLGNCYFRARKMVLAEQGREREIVRLGFVSIVADRSARFWGFLFATIAISTIITTLAIWAYQAWLWYREGDWTSVTWQTVVGVTPQTSHSYLHRMFYWLADTNFGVVVLIVGLLVAAPLAAINWRSNNKAKFRRNDLTNLKKRS